MLPEERYLLAEDLGFVRLVVVMQESPHEGQILRQERVGILWM
jgi:hypothetical protein